MSNNIHNPFYGITADNKVLDLELEHEIYIYNAHKFGVIRKDQEIYTVPIERLRQTLRDFLDYPIYKLSFNEYRSIDRVHMQQMLISLLIIGIGI